MPSKSWFGAFVCYHSQLKSRGSANNGWEDSVGSCFPTPVHTVLHTSAVTQQCSSWPLVGPLCVGAELSVSLLHIGLNQKKDSRQTKDTVNYWVLINRLSELMGDERIQLEKTYSWKKQTYNCMVDGRHPCHTFIPVETSGTVEITNYINKHGYKLHDQQE